MGDTSSTIYLAFWLLVLKSGVPEHALDALRISFKSQVLVEIYNCSQQERKRQADEQTVSQ
jgi:hypothetical protein